MVGRVAWRNETEQLYEVDRAIRLPKMSVRRRVQRLSKIAVTVIAQTRRGR